MRGCLRVTNIGSENVSFNLSFLMKKKINIHLDQSVFMYNWTEIRSGEVTCMYVESNLCTTATLGT
jgi:hypothetical protein